MTAWREWLRIGIEHAYYGPGSCTALRVQPTDATRALLRRERLLARDVPGGLAVFAPAERVPDADAPTRLLFDVVFDDPRFACYTAPPVPAGRLLVADSRAAVREPTGAWRLHARERIGPEAIEETAMAPGRLPAALRVRIAPDELGAGGAERDEPLRCVVRLDAAASHWKYYLQGTLAARPVTIVDVDAGVSFIRTDETAVGGREAAVFLSDRPIPLRAQPAQRFELREQAAFGEKVLVKRLPMGSAGGCTRALVGGQAVLVSEIFLNL